MSENIIPAVRRKDRSVTNDEWIKKFLHSSAMGTFATVAEKQPFINMNIFVYDASKNCIYFHTAKYGHTKEIIAENNKVCFSVCTMGRILPAETAMEFSVEYASVIVFGEATIVEEETEAEYALQILLDKYAPHLHAGKDYRTIQKEELARTTVYKIEIQEWRGKKKKVEDDFPGAFYFNEENMIESE